MGSISMVHLRHHWPCAATWSNVARVYPSPESCRSSGDADAVTAVAVAAAAAMLLLLPLVLLGSVVNIFGHAVPVVSLER